MRWGWILSSAFLMGCTADVVADPPLGMVLAPDGVRQANSNLGVSFGRDENGAVAAVVKLLGEYSWDRKTVENCGVTVDWRIGFQMIFVDGDFRGWTARPGRIDTGGQIYRSLPDGRIGAGVTCQ